MTGTLISNITLVEHYKQIQAHWCANDVGDNRITTAQEMTKAHDDMLEALGAIGIMNLETQWKVEVHSLAFLMSQ